MQSSNAPGKLVLPFASAGGKNTIPAASQIGIVAGKASLTDGFPPLTRTPLSAGGVPPSGLDMNGILYEMSAVIRWANAGGGYAYDATFAKDTNVGGYPKGARVMRSDGTGYWFNTVENNTTDPESAGAADAGWVPDFTTGVAAVTMTSANVTLTPAQYGKPTIVITGALTGNLNLIFPNITGQWDVINSTTGGYTIAAKTAAGIGSVLSNNVDRIFGDGTDIYNANSFKQIDAGAVVRLMSDKMREYISASDFGAIGNFVNDETVKLQNAINAAKSRALPLHLDGLHYKTSAPLDISGVSLRGLAKGYRNENGTIIEGNGTHDILVQTTATASDTRMDLQNLRIKGGACGIKVRYMLHSRWANVHVTGCVDGIQFGNSSDVGGLFNTFENIEVDVTGTGLDVNGNGFVNANSFNQCFFKGGNWGARVRCSGGIGAVGNVFNDCEFMGDRYGVELDNTSNTAFNAPYFESIGPAVHLVGTRNIGWAINNPVFALLENTNPTGKNAYIYHSGSGTQNGTIAGGWVYIPAASKYNNLSLVASELAANFYLTMLDPPEKDISASGFIMLNGLYSPNLNINESSQYTPVWTSNGTQPTLGNGSITGEFVRSGNMVTATIKLQAGSTTTFGSGNYSFSVPYACSLPSVGSAYILDSGTAQFHAVVLLNAGDTTAEAYISGGTAIVGAAVPMTWANGDSITLTISYRA